MYGPVGEVSRYSSLHPFYNNKINKSTQECVYVYNNIYIYIHMHHMIISNLHWLAIGISRIMRTALRPPSDAERKDHRSGARGWELSWNKSYNSRYGKIHVEERRFLRKCQAAQKLATAFLADALCFSRAFHRDYPHMPLE